MRVSIVIPSHNRAEKLVRAIDSVLLQTFRDFDLWIIDDGSTDNTEEVVKSYGDTDINIHYLKQENSGVSSARNLGIKSSKGEWVAFLDSDDEWMPAKLEKQIKFIEENSIYPMVYGDEVWIRCGKRVNQKNIHKKSGGDIFEKCLPLCFIAPSAALIKRSLLEEVGLFDEEFKVCEDYDLWLKISSLHPVGLISEPIIIKHGGHQDQLSTKFFGMDYFRILSMDRIKRIRSLTKKQLETLDREMIKKCTILLNGNIKHNNMTNFDEIKNIALSIDSEFTLQK
ncbi:MAG: glycosyltransferase [Bacteriovoracaceae bacterium]|nr:glycosyltransferase [Bacteriovoracaceae bacterium]